LSSIPSEATREEKRQVYTRVKKELAEEKLQESRLHEAKKVSETVNVEDDNSDSEFGEVNLEIGKETDKDEEELSEYFGAGEGHDTQTSMEIEQSPQPEEENVQGRWETMAPFGILVSHEIIEDVHNVAQ